MNFKPLALLLVPLLLTSCSGPASLAFTRGAYFEGLGKAHLAKEDPLSTRGKQQYQNAIEQFSAAIKLKSQYVDAYAHRGACYLQVGQQDNALRDLSEAVALSPKDKSLWRQRGELNSMLGYYDKAAEDFNEALQLNSKDTFALLARAECEQKLGETEHALVDLQEALKISESNAVVHSDAAAIYDRLNRPAESKANYELAMKLNPHDPSIRQRKGYTDFLNGNYKDANSDFGAVVQLSHWRYRTSPYAAIFGYFSCLLGKSETANEWLEDAISTYELPVASSDKAGDAEVSGTKPARNGGAEHDGEQSNEWSTSQAVAEWPGPAIQYLHGDISKAKFVQTAGNNRDRLTEAYCYLGLEDKASGKLDEARRKFQWIADHGSKNFIEYEVAQTELQSYKVNREKSLED